MFGPIGIFVLKGAERRVVHAIVAVQQFVVDYILYRFSRNIDGVQYAVDQDIIALRAVIVYSEIAAVGKVSPVHRRHDSVCAVEHLFYNFGNKCV